MSHAILPHFQGLCTVKQSTICQSQHGHNRDVITLSEAFFLENDEHDLMRYQTWGAFYNFDSF